MGIRELRDTLTQTLRRVRDEGEVIEVTLDGRPIATITPVPPGEHRLDRLIRLGLLRPARTGTLELDDLPWGRLPDGLTAEQIIEEGRAE